MRATSNITKNKIKELKTKKLRLQLRLKDFPAKIKELNDCIRYYNNKLNNNKSSSVHCVYSKKSNKKVLKK